MTISVVIEPGELIIMSLLILVLNLISGLGTHHACALFSFLFPELWRPPSAWRIGGVVTAVLHCL
jgi:hypothetical protein